MLLTPAEIKPKPFESRRNSFLSGADVLQIYVRASTLCRFHSHSLSGTNTPSIAFRHLPPKECVNDFGGRCRKAMLGACEWLWRKVPESDARSLWVTVEEGAGKRCSECASTTYRSFALTSVTVLPLYKNSRGLISRTLQQNLKCRLEPKS